MVENGSGIPRHEIRRREAVERRKQEEIVRAEELPGFSTDEELAKVADSLLGAMGDSFTEGDLTEAKREDLAAIAEKMPSERSKKILERILERDALPSPTGDELSDNELEQRVWGTAQRTFAREYNTAKGAGSAAVEVNTQPDAKDEMVPKSEPTPDTVRSIMKDIDAAGSATSEPSATPDTSPRADTIAAILGDIDRIEQDRVGKTLTPSEPKEPATKKPAEPATAADPAPQRRVETRFSPPKNVEPATNPARADIRTEWDDSDRQSIEIPPELTGAMSNEEAYWHRQMNYVRDLTRQGINPFAELTEEPRNGVRDAIPSPRSARTVDIDAASTSVRNSPFGGERVSNAARADRSVERDSARRSGESAENPIDLNDPRRTVTIINFDGERQDGWVYHSYNERRGVALVMKQTPNGWATDEVPLDVLRELNPQKVADWNNAERKDIQLAPWDRDVIMLERQHEIDSRSRVERVGMAVSEFWKSNGMQFGRAAVKSLFLRSVSLAGLYSPMVAAQYGRERLKVFGGFSENSDGGMQKQLRDIFAMREYRAALRDGKEAQDPRSLGTRMMDGIKGFWNETIMRRTSSDLEIQKFSSALRFIKGGEKGVYRTKDGKRHAITTPERQKMAEVLMEMRKMRGIKNQERDERVEHLFDTYILTKTSGYQVAREFLNTALTTASTAGLPLALAMRPLTRAYFDTKIRQQRMEKDPAIWSASEITMKEAFKSGVKEWWEHLRGGSKSEAGFVPGVDSRGVKIGWRQRLAAAGRLYSYMGLAAGVHDFGILGHRGVAEVPRTHFDLRHPEKSVEKLLDAWEGHNASKSQETRDTTSLVTRSSGRSVAERRSAEPSIMERALAMAESLRENFRGNAVKKHFERPEQEDIRELLQRTSKIPDERTAERVVAFVQENVVPSHDPEEAIRLIEGGKVDIDSVITNVHQGYQGGTSVSQEAARQIAKRFEKSSIEFDNPDSSKNFMARYATALQEELRAHKDKYGIRDINVVTKEQLQRLDWDSAYERATENMESQAEVASPESILRDFPEVRDYMNKNNVPVTERNVQMALEKMEPSIIERLRGVETPTHGALGRLSGDEKDTTLSDIAHGRRPVISGELRREVSDALNGGDADVKRLDTKFAIRDDADRVRLIEAYQSQRPDINWAAEKNPDAKALQLLSTLRDESEIKHFQELIDPERPADAATFQQMLSADPRRAREIEQKLGTSDPAALTELASGYRERVKSETGESMSNWQALDHLARGTEEAKRYLREHAEASPRVEAQSEALGEALLQRSEAGETRTVVEELSEQEMNEARSWLDRLTSQSEEEKTVLLPGAKVLVSSSVEEGVFIEDDGDMHVKDWGIDFEVSGPSETIRESAWFHALLENQVKAYRAQYDELMKHCGNPAPGMSGHVEQKRILFGTDDFSVDKEGNLTYREAGTHGRKLYLPNPARFEGKKE